MAGARAPGAEPPRSTAYYYADLERLKRTNGRAEAPADADDAQDARPRPEPGETYSTAGTFPMPEPKEKEPLLAELEVVGRLPLTQLDSSSGVRRSRSWYLCCPNIGDEEISRESSWRYSSLRPVTAPPAAGQNPMLSVATQSSGQEDIATLRSERDALARALAAERQRAASEARAHDARLAELHGVIAELVRRRAQDKCARAIPEEEVSDECESTTQPAGELDNDADRSRTDQDETSSLSPGAAPSPPQQPEPHDLPDDTTDTSTQELQLRVENHHLDVSTPVQTEPCDTSVNYSERDSEICVSTARCCQYARGAHLLGEGCEVPEGLLPPSPGRCESRQAKIASRVRLRRAADSDSTHQLSNDEGHGSEGRLPGALLSCGDTPALTTQSEGSLSAAAAAWRARCLRLQADCRVLDCALARALDTAHRLTCACAAQESSSVALCSALRAADRALETYDVLLALAETQPRPDTHERQAAELVARRLLSRLEAAPALGEPLLSPGPWLPPHHHELADKPQEESTEGGGSWGAEQEARLRRHAARLKTETVALRALRPPPHLFSYHDAEDSGVRSVGDASMAEMEAAVMMQELLAVREARAAERAAGTTTSSRSRRRKERERHWLDTRASETDL